MYIIGTKRVQAKLNNGILLIRVGGGFIDIDSFYNKYGEQELNKQIREEEKQSAVNMETLLVAKKSAVKFKKNLKNRPST